MVMQDLSGRARALTMTAATVGMLLLAACSRQPSVDAYAEPPPPPLAPQTELFGEGPPPAYQEGYRAEAPPPVYRPYEPAPPPVAQQGPPVVIAMEPIPNPPEPPPRSRRTVRVYRGGERPAEVTVPSARTEARRAARTEARRAARRETPARPRQLAQAPPARSATPARPAPARPVQARPAPAKPTPAAVKPQPAKITPPPQVAKAAPVKPAPAQVAKVVPPAAKPVAPATAAKPPLVAPADRATKLAQLQTALTAALSKSAVLTAPERFTTGQPAPVSLTIPAEFADVVMAEAQKQGLADVAASVNLNAVLSGDGFAVTPADMAARPLIPGQPTRFDWQVTARTGGRGPLHVDIGADMNGAGSESLSLGELKTASGFRLTPRVIGATLLVLIAGIVVAWLARSRREAPRRSVSSAASAPPVRPEPAPAPKPTEDGPVRNEPAGANDHRDPS